MRLYGCCWIAVLVSVVPVCATASADKARGSSAWTNAYDGYFKKYTKHYFGPNFDWRWFKAQGISESGLRPDVQSASGAKGLMQILPSTYAEIKERNPHFARIDEPRWNIAAGIFYDRYLYGRWQDRVPRKQRIPFTFASYNAGLGRMNRAYRKAKGTRGEMREWDHVAPHVPAETRRYVRRIHTIKEEIR